MTNNERKALELLKECETSSDVTALVTGFLDFLNEVQDALEIEKRHMDALSDEGDQVEADYVSDFLEELGYKIEEQIQ